MIFEKFILGMYKKSLLTRNDPDGTVFYFGKEDFDGLECEDLSFPGDKGQRLAAHLYFKGEKRTDRLIMFEHGMSHGGHAAYITEIAEFETYIKSNYNVSNATACAINYTYTTKLTQDKKSQRMIIN